MTEEIAISRRIEHDSRKGQTKLHRELAHRARGWLANRSTGRGIRAAFEVYLAPQYVADTVVLMSFQERYYLQLHGLSPIYSYGRRLDEMFGNRGAIDRELNNRPTTDIVVVVESKASRSDFLSTFKKWDSANPRFAPKGHLHFIVTPKKLLTIDELPAGWGLLEASGRGLSLKHWPTFYEQPMNQYDDVACRILWSGSVYDHAVHEYCPDCHKKPVYTAAPEKGADHD